MKVLLYFIPLATHIALFPFWKLDKNGDLALAELIISGILTPIYLAILSYHYLVKWSFLKALYLWMICLVLCIAGIFMVYANWGLSTCNFMSPDSETVYILKLDVLISVIILIIGWIAVFIMKNRNM